MSKFHRILCPVDLSENSLAAIKLATMIAKQTESRVAFIYVAPQWLPEEAMLGDDYIQNVIEEDRRVFEGIKPYDETVAYENILRRGNPGPEIVKEAESCDMVILSTHGHTGLMRMLLGSVAQYVMRRATCPVVTVRVPDFHRSDNNRSWQKEFYVTSVMKPADPVQAHQTVESVADELSSAQQSAAPVKDIAGHCCGIITQTDIDRYQSLVQRYHDGDPSVVQQMFEVDKYGQRRPDNEDFHQVVRHMTSPVVTIENHQRVSDAAQLFAENPDIHHLVVVDKTSHPIGIVDLVDMPTNSDDGSSREENSGSPSSQ